MRTGYKESVLYQRQKGKKTQRGREGRLEEGEMGTMIDGSLAASICHAVIGRKIEESREGEGETEKTGVQRWDVRTEHSKEALHL